MFWESEGMAKKVRGMDRKGQARIGRSRNARGWVKEWIERGRHE
jgi:hypothetical protein